MKRNKDALSMEQINSLLDELEEEPSCDNDEESFLSDSEQRNVKDKAIHYELEKQEFQAPPSAEEFKSPYDFKKKDAESTTEGEEETDSLVTEEHDKIKSRKNLGRVVRFTLDT